MSEDRELLELAARAAEIVYEEIDSHGCRLFEMDVDGFRRVWNPLTDDGDVFRLAVKLGAEVYQYANAAGALIGTLEKVEFYARNEGDPCAATRRAIVRAAADITRRRG